MPIRSLFTGSNPPWALLDLTILLHIRTRPSPSESELVLEVLLGTVPSLSSSRHWRDKTSRSSKPLYTVLILTTGFQDLPTMEGLPWPIPHQWLYCIDRSLRIWSCSNLMGYGIPVILDFVPPHRNVLFRTNTLVPRPNPGSFTLSPWRNCRRTTTC